MVRRTPSCTVCASTGKRMSRVLPPQASKDKGHSKRTVVRLFVSL